jgi:hypothetical protein
MAGGKTVDPEKGRDKGMSQFLDDKTYPSRPRSRSS